MDVDALQQQITLLSDFVKKRFGWDPAEIDDDEYGPTVVEDS